MNTHPPLTPFGQKWQSVEELYDQLSGYPGAMAEDLKDEEDLDTAISDMIQEGMIRYNAFKKGYEFTMKGIENRKPFVDKRDLEDARKDAMEQLSQSISKGIQSFEQQQPELTAEFKRIQAEQYKTFCEKMLSYGLYNISVGTNLETEKEKLLSLTGVWFRCSDKIQRLKQLLIEKEENHIKNESVEDAWKDLSVYSIISLIIINNKWINKKQE
jgi:hypothetical protein